MLKLAGKHADIVDSIPRWRGSWGKGIQDQTIDEIKRKIDRVKTAATGYGRDPDMIEFQLLSLWTEITGNPDPIIENLARTFDINAEKF